MEQSLDDQAKIVIRLLKLKQQRASHPLDCSAPEFEQALKWVKLSPGKIDSALRSELIGCICSTFSLRELDIIRALEGADLPVVRLNGASRKLGAEEELEMKLPEKSWLRTYVEYTRYIESPMSYHIACGLVTLGCALGRKCWIDMGHYKLYAPLSAILIGPTGVVHKTAAASIASNLVRLACLCPIMADKITAEKLITKLVDAGTQLIMAPEFAVFFGRQKYNEGLATLILRLLDFPPEWTADTVTRGPQTITEPTISVLGGTTLSLLSGSSAEETMSGGFLNRFICVIEESTSRSFPRPRKGAGEETILKQLKWLSGMTGEVKLVAESPGDQFYTQWYHKRQTRLKADPQLAEVIQRGPDHLLRMAMLLHLMDCNDLILCEKCVRLASELLAFFEKGAPYLIKAMHNTTVTSAVDYVYDSLVRLGGAAEHSTLLRRCSSKVNAAQFKQVIQTLNESGRLKMSKKGLASYYMLREEDTSASS